VCQGLKVALEGCRVGALLRAGQVPDGGAFFRIGFDNLADALRRIPAPAYGRARGELHLRKLTGAQGDSSGGGNGLRLPTLLRQGYFNRRLLLLFNLLLLFDFLLLFVLLLLVLLLRE